MQIIGAFAHQISAILIMVSVTANGVYVTGFGDEYALR